MTRSTLCCLLALAVPFLAAPERLPGQALYAVDESSEELRIIDPFDSGILLVIGPLVAPNGVSQGRGIAYDPVGGVMYATYETQVGTLIFELATVDLATAVVTPIGETARIRGLVFDASGVLWATTGGGGSPAHALVTVDTATGAITVQNDALPTIRNKIAYRAVSDELYLLGYSTGAAEWQLRRFSPADPSTLTPVALTGDALTETNSQPPLVHDPERDLFLENHDGNWFTITPGGVVTFVADEGVDNLGGLAFDPNGPDLVVFRDGFESGDLSAW